MRIIGFCIGNPHAPCYCKSEIGSGIVCDVKLPCSFYWRVSFLSKRLRAGRDAMVDDDERGTVEKAVDGLIFGTFAGFGVGSARAYLQSLPAAAQSQAMADARAAPKPPSAAALKAMAPTVSSIYASSYCVCFMFAVGAAEPKPPAELISACWLHWSRRCCCCRCGLGLFMRNAERFL